MLNASLLKPKTQSGKFKNRILATLLLLNRSKIKTTLKARRSQKALQETLKNYRKLKARVSQKEPKVKTLNKNLNQNQIVQNHLMKKTINTFLKQLIRSKLPNFNPD